MSEQTNVLVVEDNELDRALLDAHLSREGFATEFARDGVEAWSILDAQPDRFDLVLLDRSMPRLNGLDLLIRIKGDHRFLILPVILQSALVSRAEVIEGIRAGWLRIDQGTAYPLDRAAEAHRDIEGRGTQGKLYLEPEVSARRV